MYIVTKFYRVQTCSRHTNVCEFSQLADRSYMYIFAPLSCITFKLSKFTNFMALFPAVWTDFANWSWSTWENPWRGLLKIDKKKKKNTSQKKFKNLMLCIFLLSLFPNAVMEVVQAILTFRSVNKVLMSNWVLLKMLFLFRKVAEVRLLVFF